MDKFKFTFGWTFSCCLYVKAEYRFKRNSLGFKGRYLRRLCLNHISWIHFFIVQVMAKAKGQGKNKDYVFFTYIFFPA